jgi:hypothetical protein
MTLRSTQQAESLHRAFNGAREIIGKLPDALFGFIVEDEGVLEYLT